MNKKKFLIFGITGLFAISLVAAISYFALFSATFNVLPSIVLSDNLEQDLGEVYSGEQNIGEEITITNNAPSERTIILTDNSDGDVQVSYLGSLTLTKKDTTTWETIDDTIELSYVVVGYSFEVTGVPEDYTAVYYKDAVSELDDRVANPQAFIPISLVNENLPYVLDGNNLEETNYCQDPDNYLTCKGAKIWVIPTNAVLDNNEIDWSLMSEFYFETELVQYNADGELVIYPGQTLSLTPVYDVDVYAEGNYTITTTVA